MIQRFIAVLIDRHDVHAHKHSQNLGQLDGSRSATVVLITHLFVYKRLIDTGFNENHWWAWNETKQQQCYGHKRQSWIDRPGLNTLEYITNRMQFSNHKQFSQLRAIKERNANKEIRHIDSQATSWLCYMDEHRRRNIWPVMFSAVRFCFCVNHSKQCKQYWGHTRKYKRLDWQVRTISSPISLSKYQTYRSDTAPMHLHPVAVRVGASECYVCYFYWSLSKTDTSNFTNLLHWH